MCKGKTTVKDYFYQSLSLNVVSNIEQTLFSDNIYNFKGIPVPNLTYS